MCIYMYIYYRIYYLIPIYIVYEYNTTNTHIVYILL